MKELLNTKILGSTPSAEKSAPKVFISYAHENDLGERVEQLARYLLNNGVEAITDHPHKDKAPAKGFRAWMQHNIEGADIVLIVCSQRYKNLFEKREDTDGSGLGATWEGAFIMGDLYQSRLNNEKFYPILPDNGDHTHVPALLKDWHCDHRFPSGNERILSLICDDVTIPMPKSVPKSVTHEEIPQNICSDVEAHNEGRPQRNFHGKQREEMIRFFVSDWVSNGPSVAILEGFSGCGKTQLTRTVADESARRAVRGCAQADVPDPSMALLEDLAGKLSGIGVFDLQQEKDKGESGNLFGALKEVLRREQILVSIDDFQHLFVKTEPSPSNKWQCLVEELNNNFGVNGRLLLITNRSIMTSRWGESCVLRKLNGLADKEAASFLLELLEASGLTEKIPPHRLEEIGHRLGGNPRALMTLSQSLRYDSLEELISFAPDLFEPGDVTLDPDLIEKFERDLIKHALSRMGGEILKFMRCMAVHRRPFKKEAFAEFEGTDASPQSLRKQLIDRFLIENTTDGDSFHPLAREISVSRLRGDDEEWRHAHSLAADYNFRHFKARKVGGAQKITASYTELRHHLFEANRLNELHLAGDKLTKFALSQITKSMQTEIPDNVETLEERIALISALPEGKCPKGLEYHLALCLKHRNTGNDYQKALEHVRNAVGPHAYYATWLLLLELEYALHGTEAMLRAQKEAIRCLGGGSNSFSIYLRFAELLKKEDKLDDAIEVLEKGINTPGITSLSSIISRCARYMEEAGRFDDAINILRKGIDTPNIQEPGLLYLHCSRLLENEDHLDDAILLLKKGLKIRDMTKRHSFYLTLAEYFLKEGNDAEAIRWLNTGIADSLVIDPKKIYCKCAELLVKNNRIDDAVGCLEKGVSSKAVRDPLPIYYSFAKIMEESGNAPYAVEFLKKALSKPPISLEPSIYLTCAKLLFHARNIDEAIKVLKQGLAISNLKEKGYLCQMAAELMARQGDRDEAILLLEKELSSKDQYCHFSLYQVCSELMVKEGRHEDAIKLMRKGINAPAQTNRAVLYQSFAKLLAKSGRIPEGIDLLLEAMELPGLTGGVVLYQTCAKLMVKAGREEDATKLLNAAIVGPKLGNLVSLYQLCVELLIKAGRNDEAISLMEKAISEYPQDKNLRDAFGVAGSGGGVRSQYST